MSPSLSKLLRLLAVSGALALTASACGDDDTAADPTIESEDGAADDSGGDGAEGEDEGDDGGDVPNPCDLITLAEMETAFGFAWNEGEYAPPDIAPSATCTWSDADPGMPAKIVTLSVVTDAATEEAFGQSVEDIHNGTKSALTEADIVEDDLGLGDDSYLTSGGIYILDGDTFYSIITIGELSDDAVAGLKAMAAAVVDG
jgi:hypothetical protein